MDDITSVLLDNILALFVGLCEGLRIEVEVEARIGGDDIGTTLEDVEEGLGEALEQDAE